MGDFVYVTPTIKTDGFENKIIKYWNELDFNK